MSLLVAMIEGLKDIKSEIENQSWDTMHIRHHKQDMQKRKDLKCAVIVDAETFAPVASTVKTTGKKGFYSGFWTGTAYVFEMESAKYLGQIELNAASDIKVYIAYNQTDKEGLDSNLQDNVRSALYAAFQKARSLANRKQ